MRRVLLSSIAGFFLVGLLVAWPAHTASADDISCDASHALPGVTEGNLTLDEDVVCTIGVDHIVKGNVVISTGLLIVSGTVEGNVFSTVGAVRVHGSVAGNVNVDATRSLILSGGSVTGDAVQRGDGLLVVNNSSVDGTVRAEGSGTVAVNAFGSGATLIAGNLEHAGSGLTRLRSFSDTSTIGVSGDVKAEGGGSNIADLRAGVIYVAGNVCGGPPTGYVGLVGGNIEETC